jgi:hypothetical protein
VTLSRKGIAVAAMKEIRDAVHANPETVITVTKHGTRKGQKVTKHRYQAECVGFAQNPPRVLVRQIWAGDDDGSIHPEPEDVRIVSHDTVESVPASDCAITGVTMRDLIDAKIEQVQSWRKYQAETESAERYREGRVAPIVEAFREVGGAVCVTHRPERTDADVWGRFTGSVAFQIVLPYDSDAIDKLAGILGGVTA